MYGAYDHIVMNSYMVCCGAVLLCVYCMFILSFVSGFKPTHIAKMYHISALLDINCNLHKKLTIHIKDYYNGNVGSSN